jgi:hypothetical protein
MKGKNTGRKGKERRIRREGRERNGKGREGKRER